MPGKDQKDDPEEGMQMLYREEDGMDWLDKDNNLFVVNLKALRRLELYRGTVKPEESST